MKTNKQMTDAEFYHDWVNNFLTIDRMAEYYDADPSFVEEKINRGRIAHNLKVTLAKRDQIKKAFSGGDQLAPGITFLSVGRKYVKVLDIWDETTISLSEINDFYDYYMNR